MSPPDTDWPEPYTGWDFLQESLRQQREMEAAQREWHTRFLADLKRIEEWKP